MWLDKLKARIIPEWRQAWKFVSVRAWVVALGLIGTWVLIPESLRSSAPKEASEWIFYLVFAFGFIGLVGRVTKQKVPTDLPSLQQYLQKSESDSSD